MSATKIPLDEIYVGYTTDGTPVYSILPPVLGYGVEIDDGEDKYGPLKPSSGPKIK